MNSKEFLKFWRYIENSLNMYNSNPSVEKAASEFFNIFTPIYQQIDSLFVSNLKLWMEEQKIGDIIKPKNSVNSSSLNDTLAFKVPFYSSVYRLVAKKKLGLSHGQAMVTFKWLKTFMTHTFQHLLDVSRSYYKNFMIALINKDKRFERMHTFAKNVLEKECRIKVSSPVSPKSKDSRYIKSEEIDRLSKYFPPCMEYLHLKLRFIHRLDHHSRIRYSLFLKSAGLPFSEALDFWRNEYSKTRQSSASHSCHCNHTWTSSSEYDSKNDDKRYTYNLRHLYGMEGSRKNYSCHSCTQIQSNLIKDGEMVGCPFAHFPEKNLQNFLTKRIPAAIEFKYSGQNSSSSEPGYLTKGRSELIENILNNKKDKRYNKCCDEFLKIRRSIAFSRQNVFLFGTEATSDLVVMKPTDYFAAMTAPSN
ncbi:unnamed protein product [Gordionus sp. m RMFG-2023]|uniref:DNA primase large subunit-like n=1 Tax=Gordionus sp. m RMFG-2023 TaxID=3053472 RepID=UPI0030DE20BB